MTNLPRRVREPVQAYLEADDAQLLADVSERLALPKAEVIRLGIRRLAQDLELAQRPGAGVLALVGALDSAPDVPADLAARHDEYLYADGATPTARLRRVSDQTPSNKTANAPRKKRNASDSRRR
jgi:hypothetical protein